MSRNGSDRPHTPAVFDVAVDAWDVCHQFPTLDMVWPRPNTDNLGRAEDADRVADGPGGAGPVAVGGAFEGVVAHFAAYDAGVGA
jgi:hypothetical protein